ncbi:MAG: Asp-tRNA(Asn)/Glu-tRNA(Gln) amidotransferase subunit GatA [bacterium]|nr:Asp-tRNA(Asn)/Glu-tRNA(Gln) amidotransferase subunit GatA [bacterium]
MSIDLKNLTIKKAHEALTRGDFTAVQLAGSYLKNIEEKNPSLNAYLEVFDDVLSQAEKADKRIKEGRAALLTGIPMAIKDNIMIEGRKVSAASKILENYTAAYDATVIRKLKEAGAVFLGRTNMDEFAMGSSTENSAFGVTKNPHDTSRVAGGSSGGGAAAVAADMALAALGSDTGGSIRQPASFCGVVGLKPTYGAVSRYGLIALGSSLDCIGPLAKTVEDARIIFDCIKGKDEFDGTSVDFTKELSAIPDTISFTATKNFLGAVDLKDLREQTLESYSKACDTLSAAGFHYKTAEFQGPTAFDYSLPAYYIIMPAEASANLARFDGVKYGLYKGGEALLDDYGKTRAFGFGEEVRRRILVGAYVLSHGYYDAYYNKAQKIRTLIKETFNNLFKEADVVIWPTTPTAAWKIGEKKDPVSVYLSDIFTVSANIAGIPAISVPFGEVEVNGKRLPLGVQLMASYGRENILFEVAAKLLKF